MTCKDCEHYEVCREVERLPCRDKFIWYRAESGCPYFKDKSKIIELPLKIGETVYHIMKKAVIHWEDNKCIVDDEGEYKIYEQEFTLSLYAVFGFGDVMFATREEAEKALAERSEI